PYTSDVQQRCADAQQRCALGAHVHTRPATALRPRATRTHTTRNSVAPPRNTYTHDAQQCCAPAPHVHTRRATALRPRATALRPGANPHRPLTSRLNGPTFLDEVEDRKTSDFGGCRRYGRAG